MSTFVLPLTWGKRPACADEDPELFQVSTNEDAAKLICRHCQVRVECLADALTRREHWGVWGGLNARQRALLLRRLSTVSEVA